jgi:hypothetical protein
MTVSTIIAEKFFVSFSRKTSIAYAANFLGRQEVLSFSIPRPFPERHISDKVGLTPT